MNIYAEKIKRFYVSSYMMIVLLMLNEIQKKIKMKKKTIGQFSWHSGAQFFVCFLLFLSKLKIVERHNQKQYNNPKCRFESLRLQSNIDSHCSSAQHCSQRVLSEHRNKHTHARMRLYLGNFGQIFHRCHLRLINYKIVLLKRE